MFTIAQRLKAVMSSKDDLSDLKQLAERLVKEGPVKTMFAGPRRIRAFFNDKCVADYRYAYYVWEHDQHPQIYFPPGAMPIWREDIPMSKPGYEPVFRGDTPGYRAVYEGHGYTILQLEVKGRQTNRIIEFSEEIRDDIAALYRLDFNAMDMWYEEETPIMVHPKDPYKRVDVLPSNARIKISCEGVTLAETSLSMHVYQTGMPVRYYVPMTSVALRFLRPSSKGTKSQCAYKGEADYLDLVMIGASGREVIYPDLVWYFSNPSQECVGIKGMACFLTEKVDLWVDGSRQNREDLTRSIDAGSKIYP